MLRSEGMKVERWNMLHPESNSKLSYVEECLNGATGPIIAASDYMKIYADQIRPYVKSHYTVLGTDGFGRSDTRQKLREFFEINANYIAVAAINSLVSDGLADSALVISAIEKYNINPDKIDPVES